MNRWAALVLACSLAAAGEPPSKLEATGEFADGRTLVVFAHQDDDLLWMLPFWPHAKAFVLAGYPPAPMFRQLVDGFPERTGYRERWTPAWPPVDADAWAATFTDPCKRAPVVTLDAVKEHLRPRFAPPVKRVVTHNNWGEYGHAQHRLVNVAVRELAVEMGMDVWALGVRVVAAKDERDRYVNVAAGLGLPTLEGYFDAELFREVRAAYLARTPSASTPELTAKLKAWSPTLWTWSRDDDALPAGWRPFVKLVSGGKDLTATNAAVKDLERTVAMVNDCATRARAR